MATLYKLASKPLLHDARTHITGICK